ncbi:hypothetical protein GPECTOR_1g703 [Gonium pectorale]|uniref:EF-hand domain-containing protein n=1 Tax=Gonium pectorale TaxID=33097 RepID=A0A150H3Z2_GONPE|nr:hypothetical protein GPECTOR_1g703 [Gonium pectorale]|eukprot:KXZ56781.1 hypothetical protein GPECTOR_1g703 [Gonium pectorale]
MTDSPSSTRVLSPLGQLPSAASTPRFSEAPVSPASPDSPPVEMNATPRRIGSVHFREPSVLEVQPRHGSVLLKDLDLRSRSVLEKFDRDGDGEIEASDLGAVVDEIVKSKFQSKVFGWGMVMAMLCLVLLLGSAFGLTWAVVLSQKDTRIRNGVLMSRSTDQPLQVVNMQYTVDQLGVLTARNAGPIATTRLYEQRILHANMTASELSGLSSVYVTGLKGAQVGFRVTGFSLRPGQSPPELLLSTPGGTLVMRGEDLAEDLLPPGLVTGTDETWKSVMGIFTIASE